MNTKVRLFDGSDVFVVRVTVDRVFEQDVDIGLDNPADKITPDLPRGYLTCCFSSSFEFFVFFAVGITVQLF